MSVLSRDFRNPFVTSVILAVLISLVAVICGITLVFLSINNDPLPEWLYTAPRREIVERVRSGLSPDNEPSLTLFDYYSSRNGPLAPIIN